MNGVQWEAEYDKRQETAGEKPRGDWMRVKAVKNEIHLALDSSTFVDLKTENHLHTPQVKYLTHGFVSHVNFSNRCLFWEVREA